MENVAGNTGRRISSQSDEPKSTKTEFKTGDILYGRLRPNLNKVWKSDFDAICSTDFIVLRAKNDVYPDYLTALLLSKSINKEIVRGVTGANLPRVSSEYLLNIEIALPPLETQKQIADWFAEEAEIIAANRKLITLYEAKIADTLANI